MQFCFKSLSSFVFHMPSDISSSLADFLFLTVIRTSSSFVKSSRLMSSWPSTISSVCLSMISRRFPLRFLKSSFHFWSLSSWLADLFFWIIGCFSSVHVRFCIQRFSFCLTYCPAKPKFPQSVLLLVGTEEMSLLPIWMTLTQNENIQSCSGFKLFYFISYDNNIYTMTK